MRNRIRDTNPLQEALRQATRRRDQAQIVVQAWKASGQTMDEFTEKHDLRFEVKSRFVCEIRKAP
jgi:hypothetical protein